MYLYVARTAICIYYNKNAKMLFELPAFYQQLHLSKRGFWEEEHRQRRWVKTLTESLLSEVKTVQHKVIKWFLLKHNFKRWGVAILYKQAILRSLFIMCRLKKKQLSSSFSLYVFILRLLWTLLKYFFVLGICFHNYFYFPIVRLCVSFPHLTVKGGRQHKEQFNVLCAWTARGR